MVLASARIPVDLWGGERRGEEVRSHTPACLPFCFSSASTKDIRTYLVEMVQKKMSAAYMRLVCGGEGRRWKSQCVCEVGAAALSVPLAAADGPGSV